MSLVIKLKKLQVLFIAAMLFLFLTGCAGQKTDAPAAAPTPAPTPAPTGPSDIAYWQSRFPNQVASYLRTSEMEATKNAGSVPYQKLSKYPYMRTMYHGFGFWFDFRESRGHLYTIEDTLISGRPKFGGVCLACKSADYPAHVEKYGQKEFDTKFWSEAVQKQNHPVGCIDCHDPDSADFSLRLSRPWLEEAIKAQGKQLSDFDMRSLVCAQCHVEYYFQGPGTENKIVLPWDKGFRPEDALAVMDELKLSDFTHARTGAGLLKIQHPEFEFYQGSVHDKLGLTCVSCHMPRVKDAQGTEYTQHWLTSPLKHMEPSCQSCHNDISALRTRVETLQDEMRATAHEVGTELEKAINALRDARRNPAAKQDMIAKAQASHRKANQFLDWFLVENSTGFHNAAEGQRILNEARAHVEEMISFTEQALK